MTLPLSPAMLTRLRAHLDGPQPVVMGPGHRTVEALVSRGLLKFEGGLRPRRSFITIKGRDIAITGPRPGRPPAAMTERR